MEVTGTGATPGQRLVPVRPNHLSSKPPLQNLRHT